MLKNYFTVALRTILKHKFFSAINIVGLAIGLTVCLLVGMYVSDDLGYDKFHRDADNIYRIALMGKLGDQEINSTTSCSPMADALVQEVSGVEAATRIWQRRNTVIRNEDKSFMEQHVLMVDSNFFQFFSFNLIEGDPAKVLMEPNTIVITAELAKKYFGNEAAVGKMLNVGDDDQAYKVTGICEPAPGNSHIKFDVLLSGSHGDFFRRPEWTNNSLHTYYRKNANVTATEIDKRLEPVTIRNVGVELERFLGMNFETFVKNGGKYGYFSFPMTDTHLHASALDHDIAVHSDIKYVYVLGAIGIFVLLIACINFMNLSTARSAGRAKEVGLRKTLGSFRSHLVSQFLAESMIYTIIAAAISFVAVYALLPSFNLLSGKELTFQSLLAGPFLIGTFALILIVGLIAGSYPAFYLTSFNAVEVLKGKVRAGAKSKGIRSFLVVFQFWISIVLIICTGVVFQQLRYMQDKNLGLDKHNVLILRNMSRLDKNREAFKDALLQNSSIEAASYSNNIFPGVSSNSVFRADGTAEDKILGSYWADHDHQKVMKFELAMGRYYSKDFPSDSTACIINEATAKEFGWSDPLNKRIISFQGNSPDTLTVIGVAKDFNYETLKSQVRPLIIGLSNVNQTLQIRYKGSPQDAIAGAEELWKKYASGEPFEYVFLDESFDEIFREEQRLGRLATVLTGLAILVACMGLFGLAAFMAEQRTKEIGIRKVMGASVTNLSMLLSKEFMILVGVAFVLAIFPAWYVMSGWLQSFAFRIDLPIWIFVVSGIVAALVAWLTISYQAIKAAVANPINSIRYE
jgi:putative ABC transport system permease protein